MNLEPVWEALASRVKWVLLGSAHEACRAGRGVGVGSSWLFAQNRLAPGGYIIFILF